MNVSVRPDSRALTYARPVIQFLTGLNLLYAIGLAAMLVFSFVINIWDALGFEMQRLHPAAAIALRLVVVIGIAGAVLVHTILRRLLAIVDTVRAGDPFIADNVRRLRAIAWCVLAGEGLRLLVAAIVTAMYEPFKVEAFSFAPLVAVLLLFVLAGVFAQGTSMREDLEGMV